MLTCAVTSSSPEARELPRTHYAISCQSIEAMTAVFPTKVPEVGERMVILRFGMSIAVLNRHPIPSQHLWREIKHRINVHDDKSVNGQVG
jgi:hypothetical protein